MVKTFFHECYTKAMQLQVLSLENFVPYTLHITVLLLLLYATCAAALGSKLNTETFSDSSICDRILENQS